MENQQNQPNTGASNSSSANKSSNSSGGSGRSNRNTTSSSASASTEGNTPSAEATQSAQPTMSQQDGAQAENRNSTDASSNQENGSGSQRKSWLNQDELLKNINLNQLPQSLKDLGNKAADQVNKLSSTQKIMGGALLVGGLSWLALRSKSSKPETYTGSSAGSRYTPKGESKWRSSSESVYRGASSGLNDDTNDSGF